MVIRRKTRGGRREGAGRKNKSGTVNHMKRKRFTKRTPLHVTMKLKDKLPSLRVPLILKEFKTSADRAKRKGLRLIHFSIQENHLHLILEADNNNHLANGLRSLGGRWGKILRKHFSTMKRAKSRTKIEIASKGAVFAGRYHLTLIKTKTQMRNTLRYVLLNRARHLDFIEHVDDYSSGYQFQEWKKLIGRRYAALIQDQLEDWGIQYAETCLSPPQSWLARKGWRLAV